MELSKHGNTTLIKVTKTELKDLQDTIELMKENNEIKYYSALSGNIQIQLYDN
jgi:hypothetical protein